MSKVQKKIAQLNESISELCPVIEASNLLGDSVILLIIKDLENGEKRYNELLSKLKGVSPSTLSKRLKLLEENKIIIREVVDSTPVKITYSLSEKGLDSCKVIDALRSFGKKHLVK
jgi:DNA-binding HxlR family transcriptional regulator